MAAPFQKTLPKLHKIEPLDGANYQRWSQKLLLCFEQLEIDYVLTTDYADETDISQTDAEKSLSTPTTPKTPAIPLDEAARKKLEKDNKLARSYLLNNMFNPLFDLFVIFKSVKIIWTKLGAKYGSDDAEKRKYVVGKWLQFQIVDNKPIMEQVHVYENLCAEVLNEGMKMCEILQANVLIEKFPPFWSNYRNHLKHKKKDLTLQELISHMRTEEANWRKDKLESLSLNLSKANLVESSLPSNRDRFKGKNKKYQKSFKCQNSLKRTNSKIQKQKVVCYICGKPGHKAYQCNLCKGANQTNQKHTGQFVAQANLIEDTEVFCAVMLEVNLVSNPIEWILDIGATRHFSPTRSDA